MIKKSVESSENQVQLSMISLSMIVVCGQARVDERDGSGEIARYSA